MKTSTYKACNFGSKFYFLGGAAFVAAFVAALVGGSVVGAVAIAALVVAAYKF